MSYTPIENRYETMNYVRSGNSGLKLPQLSLGLWHNFGTCDDAENMRNMLRTAFNCGITHFDLANNYGPVPGSAEENFGRILRHDFLPYRDELIVSSKAGYTMWDGPYGDWGSRKYLLASLDQSLQRTGLEYFDIFYHHRMDPQTPLEETMGALAQAVRSGKALYAGISNYDGPTTLRAAHMMREMGCPLVIDQSRYSIFDRTIVANGLREAAMAEGLGIIAFSPLAQGLLTDKYLNGVPENSRMRTSGVFLKESALTPQRLAQIQALNAIAQQRGQSLAQMALSWVLHDAAVTSVLIGASSPAQILENAATVSAPAFSPQHLEAIEAIAAEKA